MFTLIERTNYGDGKMCPYQEEEYDTKYEMKLATAEYIYFAKMRGYRVTQKSADKITLKKGKTIVELTYKES